MLYVGFKMVHKYESIREAAVYLSTHFIFIVNVGPNKK